MAGQQDSFANVGPDLGLGPDAGSVIVDKCSLFLTRDCCHDLFVDMDFNEKCLKLAFSKGLGYSIIIASTFVKLPQLLKILSAKSGAGLSVLGTLMELLAITFNASYSFGKRYPFSAWGEALFLLFETAAIAFFILWFDRKHFVASLFAIVYSIGLYVLMSGLTPIDVLWSLQALNLPLAVTGKLLQAKTNFGNKHTGQTSALTICMLFGGCVARIFTSIQETGDKMIVVTFAAAALANFVLVAQVFYYWKSTNAFLMKGAKKEFKKKTK